MFERFPVPASIHIPADYLITNDCFSPNTPAPQNRLYTAGRQAGSTTHTQMHGGCDIYPSTPNVSGDQVFPVLPGVVFGSTRTSRAKEGAVWGLHYGNQVLLEHKLFDRKGKPFIRFSFYGHLNTLKVEKDQPVSTKTSLGTLGRTGTPTRTTPHPTLQTVFQSETYLHFAWQTDPHHKQGVIDPHPFLLAALFSERENAQAKA